MRFRMRFIHRRPLFRSGDPQRARVHSDEAGFTLIEVVLSTVLIATIASGSFMAISSATRMSGEERHRAQAYGVAEQDQVRLRSFQISALANLASSRIVNIDGTPYTVRSDGNFVTDSTGTATCTSGSASADYIAIRSTVTWPTIGARPPVVVESIVAPPNGSIAQDRGALAIAVTNAQGQGISGITLNGTGAGSFSGVTGSNGCAIFGNLPQGNYSLTPSVFGRVDKDGLAPAAMTTSVVGMSTNTVALQYDTPGSLRVSFTVRTTAGALLPSAADTVTVYNSGMTAAKTVGTINTLQSVNNQQAEITVPSLFPFAAADTVYSGSCTGDNPNPSNQTNPPGAPALANVLIPAGGIATATIQLPALNVKVMSGSSASSPGSPVNDAHVTVADRNCLNASGNYVKRNFYTNSQGALANSGLPYSIYDLCADNGIRRRTQTNVSVKTFTATGTAATFYMSGGTSGTCSTT